MQKIVPLPDARVRGPLGVSGLPRLWLLRLLAVSEMLPDGYSDDVPETLHVAIDGIGLDPAHTRNVLATRPSYLAFEAWVRENARRLDAPAIDAANAAVLAVQPDPLTQALEDWARVHADVVAARGAQPAAIVPAISSQSTGPLGLAHLPRLWLKATLAATGALYEGWKSGTESGFDCWFSSIVGIDVAEATAYIHATLPDYPTFERWFAANAAHVAPAEIEAHNIAMAQREKPEAVAAQERVVLGIDDPTYRRSREMNDLIDWLELHAIACGGVSAAPSSPT